jgi:hypothetical protein
MFSSARVGWAEVVLRKRKLEVGKGSLSSRPPGRWLWSDYAIHVARKANAKIG